MIDLVKAAANVGVKRPLLAAPGDGPPDRLQRVVRRQPGPEPVARGQEVGFEDRLEHDPRRRHHHPVGDTWNTERPQLAWFARLRDVNPAQRPRPVGPGAQPRGELVEEHAHPRVHDVVDGDPIDARGSAVGTDLAPSPPEHVAAGDLVMEGVEAAILVLLGTAVEHALESTNPVHALGATDGPSRDGTHQSPSHPPCASMKRGPFPNAAGFPDLRVLRPAPTAARPPTPLPGFAGYRRGIASLAPQATGPRRLSRVPRTTIRTFNAQYAGGFLSARSWNKSAFHGLRRARTGSAPSLPRS